MIDEGWYGSCVLNIKCLLIGTSKTITIVAMEGLVFEIEAIIETLFFDDYSDED